MPQSIEPILSMPVTAPPLHALGSSPIQPPPVAQTPSYAAYMDNTEAQYHIAQQRSLPVSPGLMPQAGTEAESVIPAVYYPDMQNLEPPMFDLNSLQNFFEWENGGDANAPPSGLEALGTLGWSNLSGVQ